LKNYFEWSGEHKGSIPYNPLRTVQRPRGFMFNDAGRK